MGETFKNNLIFNGLILLRKQCQRILTWACGRCHKRWNPTYLASVVGWLLKLNARQAVSLC
ncbi:MAG: hypothetical protein CL563_10030 [Alphaproteobacteria bacterium]|nr:hypothetical protein [Alphaproteobacteria bacterium]